MNIRTILHSTFVASVGGFSCYVGLSSMAAEKHAWLLFIFGLGMLVWGLALLVVLALALNNSSRLGDKAFAFVALLLPVWVSVGSMDTGMISGLELIPIALTALVAWLVLLSLKQVARNAVSA